MKPVPTRPNLPTVYPTSLEGVRVWAASMLKQLVDAFGLYAFRINASVPKDGSERMSAPMPLAIFAVADLPSAADWTGAIIYVSDETGGAVTAFSDGSDWRRTQDRNVVS